MTKPVRIQLKRTKGFNLQALSRATNGLEAAKVTRPGNWGNPFLVHPNQKAGRTWGADAYLSVPTIEDAMACFREMLTTEGERAQWMRDHLPELKGKNLACWCALDAEWCHADILLELANSTLRKSGEPGG